jgi:hypothetical protein
MIPHYLMLRDSIYLEGGIVKDRIFKGFGTITGPLIIKIEFLEVIKEE